jgi:NNP family nitrate/nitrite transporter-like MFS transporter
LTIFGLMTVLGSGNGSVFQIVPQRFPKEIGIVTGIVGAVGGIGGFVLPNLLGSLKDATGSFGSGFMIYTLAGLGCIVLIYMVRTGWTRSWAGEGGRAREQGASPAAPSAAIPVGTVLSEPTN